MCALTSGRIETLLNAVGELLSEEGAEAAIIVVGGATLGVMGFITRVTSDVDVIARAVRTDGRWVPIGPHPLPAALKKAVRRVARDFSLPDDWLNAEVGGQWPQGLPPGMSDDLTWREYNALHVGFAGRSSLIALKLFASVDQGPRSVHFQDLVALQPSEEELRAAREWVLTQDIGSDFAAHVDQVLEAANAELG